MLILLYFLSQNPDFPDSVKPLMGKLKNSEEMLKFLNDLSRFSSMFSTFQSPSEKGEPPKKDAPPPKKEQPCEKEKPQSPTSGIADKYIEECLNKYFSRH